MSKVLASVGSVLRSAGKALDALGATVQGKYAYIEKRKTPKILLNKITVFSGSFIGIDSVRGEQAESRERGLYSAKCDRDGASDHR